MVFDRLYRDERVCGQVTHFFCFLFRVIPYLETAAKVEHRQIVYETVVIAVFSG